MSRKISCKSYDLNENIKVYKNETDAKEHVFVNLAGQVIKQPKELQTAAALITHEETTETVCVY